ncbi:MAG: glycoside hydrolase family 92 protein [Chitinophagaceae bacterium]
MCTVCKVAGARVPRVVWYVEAHAARVRQRCSLLILFFFLGLQAVSAQQNNATYVRPFIGTAYAQAFTFWGKQGGTYPGAVSPWGYLQISPENISSLDEKGYEHSLHSLRYFTLSQHRSGYPDGAAGQNKIMFFDSNFDTEKVQGYPSYTLSAENACPGYYAATLENGIRVEATALSHSGILKVHFPKRKGSLLIDQDVSQNGDTLQWRNGNECFVLVSSVPLQAVGKNKAGCMFGWQSGDSDVEFRLGVSLVSFSNASENLRREVGEQGFASVLSAAATAWNKVLSVVEIPQSKDSVALQKFYTALYHSCLVPWRVSDVNGDYRGADRQIHRSPTTRYAMFSAWDTYRTLHPLLTWMFPQVQSDICLSMMDQYRQTGKLPTDPMTGHHISALLVDSYLKGLAFDVDNILRDAVSTTFAQDSSRDWLQYQRQGWVSADCKESVSRTLAYSLDDYFFGKFLEKTKADSANYYLDRSRKAWLLHDTSTGLLLPRTQNGNLVENPHTFGYKESDPWNSALDLYYWPDLYQDKGKLRQLLDSGWDSGRFLFDNETAFHIPYCYALAQDRTGLQKSVQRILDNGFLNTPSGIPGNDDLGSMSSWLVWSMLGIYPLTGESGDYVLMSPTFDSVVIHKAGGSGLRIVANASDDDSPIWISHEKLHLLSTLRLPKRTDPPTKNTLPKSSYASLQPEKLEIQTSFLLSEKDAHSTVDLISQGDVNVLQLSNNSVMTFFAGGWGHGTASIPLDASLLHQWNKIHCRYDAGNIHIWLNGKLVFGGKTLPQTKVKNAMPWRQYGNYEFPGERIFHGQLKNAQVWYGGKLVRLVL